METTKIRTITLARRPIRLDLYPHLHLDYDG